MKPIKIAIASGKGGTGKTFISVNLANYLSKKHSIVLADMDAEEPNSSIFINGEIINKEDVYKMSPKLNIETCTFCGNCGQICKFNAIVNLDDNVLITKELCHSCYACSELCPTNSLPMHKYKIGELTQFKKETITLLEAKLNVGEEQAVPLIDYTHDYLNKNFSNTKFQIIDSPPGNSCPLVATIKQTDLVLIVAEPTKFGFNDFLITINTAKFLNIKTKVIINKFDIGDDEVEKFCLKNNILIIAKIPFKKEIAKKYSNGELITDDDEFNNILAEIETQITN